MIPNALLLCRSYLSAIRLQVAFRSKPPRGVITCCSRDRLIHNCAPMPGQNRSKFRGGLAVPLGRVFGPLIGGPGIRRLGALRLPQPGSPPAFWQQIPPVQSIPARRSRGWLDELFRWMLRSVDVATISIWPMIRLIRSAPDKRGPTQPYESKASYLSQPCCGGFLHISGTYPY